MILHLLVQEQLVFNSLYFKIDQTLFGFTMEKATNIQFSDMGQMDLSTDILHDKSIRKHVLN